MGTVCEFFDSPEKILGLIAVIAAIGLVGFGIGSFVFVAKSSVVLDKVVAVFSDVLLGAAGAKAGLSMAKKSEDPKQ